MKTIALANQKGGVGKTTTAASLGIGLSRQGKKVLLFDADAQGNLTQMLGWPQPDELSPTLSTLMEKIIAEQPIAPGEGILHHPSGVHLVPANIELSALEVTLVNTMSRETVLRQYLSTVADRYDYALIDCMPSLGMLTINSNTFYQAGSLLKRSWSSVSACWSGTSACWRNREKHFIRKGGTPAMKKHKPSTARRSNSRLPPCAKNAGSCVCAAGYNRTFQGYPNSVSRRRLNGRKI